MASMSAGRLGALDLVDVGELEPSGGQVPQPDGGVAGGRVDEDRVRTASGRRRRSCVGTPKPPRATTRSCSAMTSSPVVGSSMASATSPGSSPISARIASATSGRWGLRPSTWSARPASAYQRSRRRHVLAAQQGADPHHRPPVGPVPLPGVLLALLAVDLLQAEEPPADVEPGLVADVPDPQGGLVGVGAHDVEVEVDAGGSVRTVALIGAIRSVMAASRLRPGLHGPGPPPHRTRRPRAGAPRRHV